MQSLIDVRAFVHPADMNMRLALTSLSAPVLKEPKKSPHPVLTGVLPLLAFFSALPPQHANGEVSLIERCCIVHYEFCCMFTYPY